MTTLAFMVSQELPFAGKRRLRAELSTLDADAIAPQVARSRRALVAAVTRAYVGLVLSRELLELAAEQERLWKQIEGTARARYAVGQGAQPDVLRVQIEVTRVEQLRTLQQAEASIRAAELNRLLDRPSASAVETAERLALEPFDESLASVLERLTLESPELYAAALAGERAGLALAVAQKEYKPDFSVQAGYMNRGGLEPMWQAGVGVTLPVHRKRLASGLAEAEAQARASARLADSREAPASLQDRGAAGPARGHREARGALREGHRSPGPAVGRRRRRQLPDRQGPLHLGARGAHDSLQRPRDAPRRSWPTTSGSAPASRRRASRPRRAWPRPARRRWRRAARRHERGSGPRVRGWLAGVREGACDEALVTRGGSPFAAGRRRGAASSSTRSRDAGTREAAAATGSGLPLPDASELRLRQARQLPDLRHEARAARPASHRGAEVLYYRSPMDPSVRSDKPAKDSMGMDFVPVYADEAQASAGRSRQGEPHSLRRSGRCSASAARRFTRPLARAIRTVGRVAVDERRLHHIHTKYDGYVEHLYVDFTGKFVERGEPPALDLQPRAGGDPAGVPARLQRAEADGRERDPVRGAGLARSARGRAPAPAARGTSRAEDIEALERAGKVSRTLDLHSEIAGYVVQKMAFHGMRVTPADTLFDIADLTQVWVLADVYESDLPLVRVGMMGELTRPLPARRDLARRRHLHRARRSRRRRAPSRSGSRSTTGASSSSPTCSPTSSCSAELGSGLVRPGERGDRQRRPQARLRRPGRRPLRAARGRSSGCRVGERLPGALGARGRRAGRDLGQLPARFRVAPAGRALRPWRRPRRSRRRLGTEEARHDQGHHPLQRPEPLPRAPGHGGGRGLRRLHAPPHPGRRDPRPLRHPGDRLLALGPQPRHHRGPGHLPDRHRAPRRAARSRSSAASPTSATPTSTSSSRTAPTSTGRAAASSSTCRKIQPRLPAGVRTELGPDATGVGWVFQYALVDDSGTQLARRAAHAPGLEPALPAAVRARRRRGGGGRRLREAVPGHRRPEPPQGLRAPAHGRGRGDPRAATTRSAGGCSSSRAPSTWCAAAATSRSIEDLEKIVLKTDDEGHAGPAARRRPGRARARRSGAASPTSTAWATPWAASSSCATARTRSP